MATSQATINAKRCSLVRLAQCTPEELIKLLVNQMAVLGVTNPTDIQTNGNYCEEIILDMDLDGARYLLVRMPKATRPQVQLSPREREIVRMVAQGHPNKIIADVLNISSWTVCTHLRRIFAKLGVGSRAAMVARMMENGNSRERNVIPGVAATTRPDAGNRAQPTR